MELPALLDGTREVMAAQLSAVEDQHWELPTPCDEWNVRDLVDHVVTAEAVVGPMLGGVGPTELVVPDELREKPALDAFRHAATEANEALLAPGATDAIVKHPAAGDIPGVVLAGFRIVDRIVHAWDLAVATGGDRTLPPDLVAAAYELVAPVADLIANTGRFASPVELPGDADLQARLLALLGRDPS